MKKHILFQLLLGVLIINHSQVLLSEPEIGGSVDGDPNGDTKTTEEETERRRIKREFAEETEKDVLEQQAEFGEDVSGEPITDPSAGIHLAREAESVKAILTNIDAAFTYNNKGQLIKSFLIEAVNRNLTGEYTITPDTIQSGNYQNFSNKIATLRLEFENIKSVEGITDNDLTIIKNAINKYYDRLQDQVDRAHPEDALERYRSDLQNVMGDANFAEVSGSEVNKLIKKVATAQCWVIVDGLPDDKKQGLQNNMQAIVSKIVDTGVLGPLMEKSFSQITLYDVYKAIDNLWQADVNGMGAIHLTSDQVELLKTAFQNYITSQSGYAIDTSFWGQWEDFMQTGEIGGKLLAPSLIGVMIVAIIILAATKTI